MKNIVVYKTTPEFADRIVDLLRENHLDPIVLDQPNLITRVLSFGSYRVRIALPEDQRAAALKLIEEEEAASAKRVEALTKGANKALLKALLIYLSICLLFYLAGGAWNHMNFLWSFVLTIIYLAVSRAMMDNDPS